jgi:hypothetical protein
VAEHGLARAHAFEGGVAVHPMMNWSAMTSASPKMRMTSLFGTRSR